MSAVIIPFRGEWEGNGKPTADANVMAAARALHDARLIAAAKADNDDWTARVLLAILQTLSTKQLDIVEFRLCGQSIDTASAVQALAVVQFAKGNNSHRERVKNVLAVLETRE
jgi:hypothetical protein